MSVVVAVVDADAERSLCEDQSVSPLDDASKRDVRWGESRWSSGVVGAGGGDSIEIQRASDFFIENNLKKN